MFDYLSLCWRKKRFSHTYPNGRMNGRTQIHTFRSDSSDSLQTYIEWERDFAAKWNAVLCNNKTVQKWTLVSGCRWKKINILTAANLGIHFELSKCLREKEETKEQAKEQIRLNKRINVGLQEVTRELKLGAKMYCTRNTIVHKMVRCINIVLCTDTTHSLLHKQTRARAHAGCMDWARLINDRKYNLQLCRSKKCHHIKLSLLLSKRVHMSVQRVHL